MVNDELAEHLNSLQRDDCYRVDSTIKETPYEITEKVYFVGSNGAEQGPYIRKYIEQDAGLGSAYLNLYDTQRSGRRFRHLPSIHDCYSLGSKFVVIMEYVPGETLSDVVYRCDPSITLATELFPQLCDAVIELHQGFDQPIIHRDLKPSNVMLTQNNLTIIDFGIARTYKGENDEDTNRFGTKAYAPPEQYGYGQTDVRSDIYALGALLYFCLTEKTLDYKVQKSGFTSVGVSGSIREVLIRATEFDPEDRFQSVEELKSAFLAASSEGSGKAVPIQQGGEPSLMASAQMDPSSTLPKQANTGIIGADYFQAAKKSTHPLSLIPPVVGALWDGFLLLLFVLFIVVAFSMIFTPEAGSQGVQMSLGKRALQYGSAVLCIIGPALYLVSDRRPLRYFGSLFAQRSLMRDIVTCGIIFVVGVVAIMLSGEMA